MLKNTRLRMTTLFIISILAILFLYLIQTFLKMMLNIHLKEAVSLQTSEGNIHTKKLMVSLYMLPNKI